MLLLGFSRFRGNLHKTFSRNNNSRKQSGFTLAEVLITLGIIGVVAAMTMPTLIQNYQEKVTVTKLKKFYSTVSQAYQRAVIDNGTPENWGLQTDNSKNMITALKPYIKFDKICDVGQRCHSASHIYWKDGTEMYNYFLNTTTAERYSARLSDGVIIGALVQSPNCSQQSGASKQLKAVCGEYTVDINGDNGPNKYGTDIFMFELTKYGIIPRGTSDCTIDNYSFENSCLTGRQGWGCTAWVVYNGNMDYFHCDDLSWSGKTKCK